MTPTPVPPTPTPGGGVKIYLDGSTVGLTTENEDIDAIGRAPDGRLVISTRGSFAVPGLSGKDEDLLVFNSASGMFDLYFDGSNVGLGASSEDVQATWIDPTSGEIYLVKNGSFTLTSPPAARSDIFICAPGSLGLNNTSCTYSFYWDASASGFVDGDVGGFLTSMNVGSQTQLQVSYHGWHIDEVPWLILTTLSPLP